MMRPRIVYWSLIWAVLFSMPFSKVCAQHSDLSGLKICIDPGHGGFNPCNDRRIDPDPGSGNIFWESEGNFRKALFLKSFLEARGAVVYLTRTTNDSTTKYLDHPVSPCYDENEPSLSARWQLANANTVNWFHSIHSNATGGTNTSTNYTLVLLKENISTRQAQFPAALTMSDDIYRRIRERNRTGAFGVALDYTFYGGPNGGFNLGVLSGLNMPGELSEGSFHDYYPETRRLLNNQYRKNEAYGIFNGFLEYYGAPFDTLGVIAGTQVNKSAGNKPINNIVVRLLPVDKVYDGETYNNGFFFFDSLPAGDYSVLFQTASYPFDTVKVTIAAVRSPVASTDPGANAVGVIRSKVISISFLRSMDTAKVRSVFSISPLLTGDIAWSNNNTVMTFTPKSPLNYKTTYTINLAGLGNSPSPLVFVDNTTVTSNVGSASFSFAFTTETLPPVLVQTQPKMDDTSFSVTSAIGLRFSESMDTASVRGAFSISPTVKGKITWTSGNMVFLFNADSALPFNTDFTITIAAAAKSVYGLYIDGNKDSVGGDAFVLKFRTMKNPSGVVPASGLLPTHYSLEQNFPNPFNPNTEIQFSLPYSSRISLRIYNVLGEEIGTLAEGNLGAGNYRVVFDGTSLPSGVYIVRLVASDFRAVRKMVLAK